ncbi:hypothetical protein [Sphingomonas sp. 28-62-11]|uniref:hypothetical protein n=1 Tax=Sphingomonas sp. 28-62-11 TaxID=1970432 RepID=UPI0035A87CE9
MTRSIPRTTALLLGMSIALAACTEPARPPAQPMAGANMTDMPMPDGIAVDMAAVPMYPGSTMIDMKIMPHEEDDMTGMAFDSPADPATVRRWYIDTLGAKGFMLKEQGTTVVGTDPAGNPVHIDVKPAAAGHSTGVISKG